MTNFRQVTLMKILVLTILGLLLTIAGCGDSGSGTVSDTPDYVLKATAVQDPNLGYTIVIATVLKDGDTLGAADLTVDTALVMYEPAMMVIDTFLVVTPTDDTTRYIDTVGPVPANSYGSWLSSSSLWEGSAVLMSLDDPDVFDASLPVTFTGDYGILVDGIVPANHIVQATDAVSVDWSGAANAETYVLATVKAGTGYNGSGYSEYPATQTTDGTIPPSAFREPITDELDTGLYEVYVYALNGTPDSALTHDLLPVPLPSQLADNLDREHLTGRVGTVGVTLLDTVRVVSR